MAKNGVTRITGHLVPRQSVKGNKENPFRGTRHEDRTNALAKTLGQVWFSIYDKDRIGTGNEKGADHGSNDWI